MSSLSEKRSVGRWTQFDHREPRYLADVPVVYALSDGQRVLYVGQTNNLRRRFYWYLHKWRHAKVAKARIVGSLTERLAIERRLIAKLKPAFNVCHTGRRRSRQGTTHA